MFIGQLIWKAVFANGLAGLTTGLPRPRLMHVVVVVVATVVVVVVTTVVVVVATVVVVVHEDTVMATFVVVAPNHWTPSWTILHWKLYVPGDEGAVIVNENALFDPGVIDSAPPRFTRLNPHTVLSCGF